MARKRDRFFAGFGALLFLGTSSALTIAVIIVLVQQSKANNTPATTAATTVKTPTTTKNTTSTTKLAGTKMQNFTPVSQVTSLQTTDVVVGTGAVVKPGDTITADYTGALASTGVIFQSSLDTGQPFTSPLSGLIKGWQEGLPGMKVGGTRRLLIPAALAYGDQAQSGIPANSNLVFDVTVHSVK